jgi:hypothetical protein
MTNAPSIEGKSSSASCVSWSQEGEEEGVAEECRGALPSPALAFRLKKRRRSNECKTDVDNSTRSDNELQKMTARRTQEDATELLPKTFLLTIYLVY